ncbi:MAG: archease [Candidatus Bathyarchaeota archaeon]|nr:MAG: archease [Candidatus Bathyarchaeota archaeon]
MSKEKKFEFLEHRADVYIKAYGKSLENAFENAALATFETMTEINEIEPKHEETIKLEGFDVKALLYNWLEALLIKYETTEYLYSRFRIKKIEKADNGYKLTANIQGEKFNPKKHPQKVGVKAITYHRMEIIKNPSQTIVKFILDI